MNMEMMGGVPVKEGTIENPDKNKIVEEVFRKYHKKLIRWCEYKLLTRYGRFLSNPKSDAEEIVAGVYEKLLRDKNLIDLNRNKAEIKAFLNIVLDHTISHFIVKGNAKKRNPEGGLVFLEEIVGENEEEDLPAKLKQYFAIHLDDKEEIYAEIEQALSRLESRNPKMAGIIRKRYQKGKNDVEIAKDYGDTRQNIHSLRKKAEGIIRNIISRRIKSDLSIPIEKSMKRSQISKDQVQ